MMFPNWASQYYRKNAACCIKQEKSPEKSENTQESKIPKSKMVTKALEASDLTISEYDNLGFDESYSIYQNEWNSLFSNEFYLDQLKSMGKKGLLKDSNFRSTCWKVLLECLPENRSSWIEAARSQRQQYTEILERIDSNPRDHSNNDIAVNHPLSQAQQNPWNQYFKDRDLKLTIEQDVVRTFPEVEFFHTEEIQTLMINILFAYAREFPHLSYKQGMHELLAPIIYVLYYDKRAYLVASETNTLDLEIHILLNQNYIEHDAFFIFCNLMNAVESWYAVNDSPNSKYVSLITQEPFSQTPTSSGNPLAQKLKRISEHLLRKWDLELFAHLEQMEIIPQMYGIRWLRLLFGREFPLNDLLILWDAIFSDSVTFELVDYIFLAMLISIRDLLLRADYSSCLRHLMRFPNTVDVRSIIDLAFRLRKLDNTKKSDKTSIKVESFIPWKAFKDTKQNVTKPSTKSVYPGIAKPVNKAHSSLNKYSENRPKSLSLASVNMLWGNSADSSSGGARPKSSSLSEKKSNPDSAQDDLNDSSLDYLEKGSPWAEKKSSTLPRARIQNVMEIGSDRFDSGDSSATVKDFVGTAVFLEKDSGTKPTETLYKEMVPIALPSSPAHNSTVVCSAEKDDMSTLKEPNEILRLRTENCELKAMNVYCSHQITRHIDKLQESMMNQRLKHEDEMFIALAGLKQVRDILRGTVDFSEVVDDINPYSITNDNVKHSSQLSSSDLQVEKKFENINEERIEASKDDSVCAKSDNTYELAKCTFDDSSTGDNSSLSKAEQYTPIEHVDEDACSLAKEPSMDS